MLSDRLSLALESGAVTLPATGTIAVIGPRAGADLSVLPKDRIEIVTRLFPDHRAFREAGYSVRTDIGGPYSAAILCLPRSKAEAQAMIAAAREATAGALVIDGAKTDGVDSVLRAVRSRAVVGEVLSKAHGKIFAVEGGDFRDWKPNSAQLVLGRFTTRPGVFSADGVDPASEALAAALPADLSGRVVDLGAGWGFLADAILSHPAVTRLDLVEADRTALDCAEINVTDPRAHCHWADARDFRPEAAADHVVTNPPFHESRAADPSLGQAFIRAAAGMLKPRGRLWLVANRHLPYEKTLQETFRDVRIIGQTPSFKLYMAAEPRTPRKG